MPRCYGNSRAMWDHITVLPATWQRYHSHLYPSQLSKLRLALDLATPEGYEAELT